MQGPCPDSVGSNTEHQEKAWVLQGVLGKMKCGVRRAADSLGGPGLRCQHHESRGSIIVDLVTQDHLWLATKLAGHLDGLYLELSNRELSFLGF